MLLAGDIGGTNVRLGLFERDGDGVRLAQEQSWRSHSLPSLENGVEQMLIQHDRPRIDAACFGVAGAVIDGRCHTTNLPWIIEESVLSAGLGGTRVKLLNDVEAAAYGMLHVTPDKLAPLHPKPVKPRRGNIAVVSVGTGLGEAILFWDGRMYSPIASEGGHTDFAPQTEQQVHLLEYLQRQLNGHVSYERVAAGPGLSNIYAFLRDTGFAPESAELRARLEAGDRNAIIAELGLAGTEPLCVATLDLFCAILGAEAGNLALKCFALGGVYLAGGIPPKLLPALQSDRFWKSFIAKGRFEELLGRLPVWVNRDPGTPLLGSAHYARRLADQSIPT